MNSINLNQNTELISKLDPLSNQSRLKSNIDDFIQNFSNALGELSSLDDAKEMSGNAIKNAKTIIKNWQDPTDNQVDLIFSKMTGELLA